MLSARLLVGSAALLAVARPVSAMSVWHPRALDEHEGGGMPPAFFLANVSSVCSVDVFENVLGNSTDGDSDPLSTDDYDDINEECGVSAQIQATYNTFQYCDDEGDIDDFGAECEDVVELLEFFDCYAYGFANAIYADADYDGAIDELYFCDATEKDIVKDDVLELIAQSSHSVSYNLRQCGGPGRHPCIASGGPAEVGCVLPHLLGGPECSSDNSDPGSDPGSDVGSDTDGAGLAIALAGISLSAAALLA